MTTALSSALATAPDAPSVPHGALPLPDWAVLRASGPDAASFLQGQLTQSVTDLAPHEARLGGYCSAKGRLLAGFILCRDDAETVDLLLPRDLLAPLQKKLSMFVLRAKCKLAEAPVALQGVVGDAVPQDLPVWGRRDGFIRLPDALGQRRALCGAAHPALPAQPALAPEAWAWLELQAGLPWVVATTSEHFVPQMINWELLGGVNFKKGCFPGQEVVARSQYRGTVKRRAQLLLGGVAAPGSELLQHGEAVGEVLMAAAWQGQTGLLAELQLAAWEADAPITLADGTPLRRGALPYAVKAPE